MDLLTSLLIAINNQMPIQQAKNCITHVSLKHFKTTVSAVETVEFKKKRQAEFLSFIVSFPLLRYPPEAYFNF